MNKFEERLLKAHLHWFRTTTPEERRKYIDARVARLSPAGLRVYNRMTRGLR